MTEKNATQNWPLSLVIFTPFLLTRNPTVKMGSRIQFPEHLSFTLAPEELKKTHFPLKKQLFTVFTVW